MARLSGAVAAVALLLTGCSSDGGDTATTTTTFELPSTTSTTVDLGGLPLVVPDGYRAIPAPKLGFGLAVPDGWQVTLLTDDALQQLEDINAASPAFVATARQAKDAGAILYGAGIDPEDRVSDLKVQKLAPGDLGQLAESARTAAPSGATVDLADERARIRFQVTGGGVTAEGTQWLIPGPDGVWSLIITSEDKATHDELAMTIADSLVFG